MLTRFCLYGFLKNQRFFEPFLILVYLDRGLTFAGIGTLVAAQQLMINLAVTLGLLNRNSQVWI